MILLYLFILIVFFHSTSQHLWLSYSVLFHCIIYSFHSPILLLLIMPSSMIVSYYLPLSHHISHVILRDIRPTTIVSIYLFDPTTNKSLLSSSKPKHSSFLSSPFTRPFHLSLENCVGVNYTLPPSPSPRTIKPATCN